MSLNTFYAVLLAQLDQADLPYLAIPGPTGPEVEIDTPTGPRLLLTFDRDGDLRTVAVVGEATDEEAPDD